MVVFPNCKINLGLHILRKRSDGYHDLETIFYPLPLLDCLEIIENKNNAKHFSLPFTCSGLSLDGDSSSNLCVKAYRLLKKDFPQLPNVKIHLHKQIPSGAGLGGGSADGAFTLTLLNEMFALGCSQQQLLGYASHLGSDCPLFILNKPCYATGRGEILEPLRLGLDDYYFIIVNPGIHIDTGRAFLEITPTLPELSLKDIISLPVEQWKDQLHNDFEKILFKQHWEVVEIKDELYRLGALYASMSGSGSTVYGIFKKGSHPEFRFPENYFVRILNR